MKLTEAHKKKSELIEDIEVTAKWLSIKRNNLEWNI